MKSGKSKSKTLDKNQESELLSLLKTRFEKNMQRHKDCVWKDVETRLLKRPECLWSLNEMEKTGGEPDVVGMDKKTGEFVFFDCSAESPKARRSFCYDHEALEERKEFKPEDSAINRAEEMGVQLLNEEQYYELQKLGAFDLKTSSWLKTPAEMRKLGGALFGDCRFKRTFIYHNGASSYYAARGFRAFLNV